MLPCVRALAPVIGAISLCMVATGCGGAAARPVHRQDLPRVVTRPAGLDAALTAPLYEDPARLELGLVSAESHAPATFPVRAKSEQAVPEFSLVDSAGVKVSSDYLVGHKAFVVVFFASWCEICARKMPVLRRASEKVMGIEIVLVSVDGKDTEAHVPGFLREQRLAEHPYVSGMSHPDFVRAYNPISSIPLIAVVGQNGELVDYQVGLDVDDGPRLESALRTALLVDAPLNRHSK